MVSASNADSCRAADVDCHQKGIRHYPRARKTGCYSWARHFLRWIPCRALGSLKSNTVYHYGALHALHGRENVPSRQKSITRRAVRLADKIICVSRLLAESIYKYGAEKQAEIIPNMIDTQFFVPSSTPTDLPFMFINITSFEPRKRPDLLIKAFHQAFHDNANVELTFVGEGAGRAPIEALIAELGLTSRISSRRMAYANSKCET